MDNSIKELALYAAKRKVPTEFAQRTVEDVNDALRNELKQFSDFNYYRKNKYDLFELIQEVADEVLPKEVESFVSVFADASLVDDTFSITGFIKSMCPIKNS